MDASIVPLASSKPHALVFPALGHGHINPILNFSLHLAVRGFIITFVNTEEAHNHMLDIQSQSQHNNAPTFGVDIRFASIPDGSQQSLPGQRGRFQTSNAVELLQGIASQQQELLEEMVINSRATPTPITCLIADVGFPWTKCLANKLGIKRASFCPSNAAALAATVEITNGKLKITDAEEVSTNENVTAGVPVKSSELLATLPLCDPERLKVLKDRLDGVQDATCIVVNTLEELEAPSLEASASCLTTNILCVGPLLPPSNDKAAFSPSFYQEDSICMPWLDQQAVASVLYIAFGSVSSLSAQQLEELAFGIEQSKQPFLWVARGHTELFPEGFLDRTHGHGLVINWAPQIQVLGHVAVGGFLTHCGWNSTLESIHMGVPMLCYPMRADQYFNALLITKVWELGIGMEKGKEEDVIRRGEVQKAVTSLMHSQELHVKAATWKTVAHRALEEGGSSYSALESVIHDLTKVA